MTQISNSRESILNRIRKFTGRDQTSGIPEKLWTVPEPRYDLDPSEDLVAGFTSRLNAVHGTLQIISDISNVPDAAADYLSKAGEASVQELVVHKALVALDWGSRSVTSRKAVKSDSVSVTLAYAGIAETGTVVMISSPDSPTTQSYLPDTNIVVLKQSRLLATVESLWPLVENQPRALNFITGPSKTADIEQTIVYGAHGPRRFHVIFVKDASSN
jgi:L-lactate dehydrogenase complex protein LldG